MLRMILVVQQVRDPCLVLEHELGGEEHDVRKFLAAPAAELDHLSTPSMPKPR